ncbi:UDP-N-acetylmuramoyl-L-alanine--D-glutamate ligase [Helicobacter turcicus]|uniref:UDP-N-acetylmuramoylalanine--D-glutamate ligase n=1 Tax=Helicobacter turcicus TaxID=2867412 RepID=A0ABS7JNX1_9HELI|nr:UDP-N-acetylmuramoyl-L-alanine--D-glutamate ligase [Helicobacter turcicus]MBX7491114.1 UDP-N-acetylmuramoyl-L-alanine--D-glutamate ligase [Helicobacter turcicus]MBX7545978.1 UDP-N-acetylmuramoyl-L-alanine--D-glutamate ligase [Helicobacter turcicus]
MLILLGFGGTNQAIAEAYAPVLAFDDSFNTLSYDSFGNALYPSAYLPEILATQLDAQIITSPGIPPSNTMVQTAISFVRQYPKMRLLSEYDFFAHKMPASVWISGTNGKTTTTQMLTHLLQHLGTQSGGNIGTPLAKLDDNSPLWVLETSSFTLHYTNIAKPNLYLLLPISQDHISWHGSYEDYVADKLKPILSLKEKEIAILPKSVEGHSHCRESLGRLVFYETSSDLAQAFELDLDRIGFKEPFLLDATLALCAAKILSLQSDYALLNTFKIGAHKMEEFYDKGGNLWVDDSKGTNIDATMEALKCYKDKKILLVLGGDDKGADLSPLFGLIQCLQSKKREEIEIFAIGSNTEKVCEFAQGIVKSKACYTLDVAVKSIKQRLLEIKDSKNCVAMLSPAAASLDQFSSYKERGEKFKTFALS